MEMEASDMLDVLHYFFEEDINRISTAEQSESVDGMRKGLYLLYGKQYKYGTKDSSNAPAGRVYVGDTEEFSMDAPLDPSAQETKPFVPATDFNPESSMPFGGILDAPLA